MSHKSKGPKKKPPATKELGEAEEECCHCQTNIAPTVQIDVVQDLREDIKASNNENHTQNRKQLFWTRVAAGLVFLYTFVSGWQLKVARDTYSAANRPYVGTNGANIAFLQRGGGEPSRIPNSDSVNLAFRFEIKNFGPIPGTDFRGNLRAFRDGIEEPPIKISDSPSILFPGESVYLGGQVGEQNYALVEGGKMKIMTEISVDYRGPSGHYKYCEQYQYESTLNHFVNLGAQCRKPN